MAERAAIYVRVSSDQQRDNYSPPTQLRACREYAQQNGYALVGNRFVDPVTAYDAPSGPGMVPAFVDDYTSWELSRPALDAALEYARTEGYDVLIVHALDRLARDPYIRQTLERELADRGVKVRYVLGNYEETPEGEVRKDLEATFAKWESAKRLERSLRGKMGKAQRGLFVGGRPPYGYEIDPDSPGGLKVCEGQAAVIREIFDLYVWQRMSARQVAAALTAEGIRPWRGGERWGKSTIQRILANEAYVGRIHYNKHVRKGKRLQLRDYGEWVAIEVTPIVDRATYAAAQLRLFNNRERARRQPKREYLLSGLVVCDECGLAYHTQAARAGKERRTVDQLSYRHRISAGHCLNRTLSARRLEPAVWEAITAMLLEPEKLRRGYEASIAQQQAAHARKRQQLDVLARAASKVKAKTDKLLETYLDPEISLTKEQYLSECERLKVELTVITNQRQIIEAELAQIPGQVDLAALDTYAANIREFLKGGIEPSFNDKRTILEKLHTQVMIAADGSARIEGWFGDPVAVNGLSAITS